MTAITRAALRQRIRYELGDRPWRTTGTTVSGVTTGVDVPDGADWEEGNVGEWESDGDSLWVNSVSVNTLTVTRSYNGSTGTAHTATALLKNPRYPFIEINNAIEGVIQDLPWPRVYKKVSDSITPDPTTTIWYDLAADARALIHVTQAYGPADVALGFFGVRHMAPRVVFERNLPAAMCPTGVGLQFPDGFYHDTNVVNVDYAAKITDAGTSSYDDLNEGDILVEAVVYGAIARLEAALEQGKPRKPRQDRETLRGASLYERKYQEALNRTTQELRATIPLMGTRRF